VIDREIVKRELEARRRFLEEIEEALLEVKREFEEADKAYRRLNEALANEYGMGRLELRRHRRGNRVVYKLYFNTLTGRRIPIEERELLEVAIWRSQARLNYIKLSKAYRRLLKAFKQYEAYVNYYYLRE